MEILYRRRAGLREQAVGDERMLFDDDADSVHVLNGSAAFIWDCLREPVSVRGIEARLREEYDLSAVADVPGVIERTLRDFLARRLAETTPAEPPAVR